MKNKRIIGFLTLIICFSFLLTSCFSEKVLSEEHRGKAYSMSYRRLETPKEISFELLENAKLKIMVITRRGNINIDIYKILENGTEKSYYMGTDIPTGDYYMMLDPGEYKISIIPEKHTGGFTIIY